MDINQIFISLMQRIRHPFLDGLFIFASVIVDWGFWYWFIILGIVKKDKFFLYYLGGLLSAVVVQEYILKNLFQVLRPCVVSGGAYLIDCPNSYSFPSGHSTSSFLAATMLYHYNKKLGIVGYVFAFLVALSRTYLNAHYFTDILVGSLLGIYIGFLFVKIYEKQNVKT